MSQILESNADLYRYLTALADILKQNGAESLAEQILFSARFYKGSSSEFFFEAEKALRKVRDSEEANLESQKVTEISRVIIQIQDAFKKVGGA